MEIVFRSSNKNHLSEHKKSDYIPISLSDGYRKAAYKAREKVELKNA